MKKILAISIFTIMVGGIVYFFMKNDRSELTTKSAKKKGNFFQRHADRKPSSIKRKRGFLTPKKDFKSSEKDYKKYKGTFKKAFNPKTGQEDILPYANYFKDKQIVFNNKKYILSNELSSVDQKDFDPSFGQEVMRTYSRVFYLGEGQHPGLPTLYNISNRRPAAITGRILVQTNDLKILENFGKSWNFKIDKTMAHLGIYSIEAASNTNIIELYNNISEQGGIL